MKEEIITFETSKLAKEKGFTLTTDKIWLENAVENLYADGINVLEDWEEEQNYRSVVYMYCAPTQSLLQRWLREVYNIHICVDITLLKEWYVNVYNIKNKVDEFKETYELLENKRFDNYEEALEAGLYQALKLI